ncbi:hypothetical protein E2C01_016564 [Portunus trituberculatus]|uniref:Uncharacterized protein n=1 Tax=Portunus trituberculatus TaxID=210409 RepID=A0A5B7DR36_PORTR|nr:hypothetical protein [Portunus trituberculatus]
MKATVHQGCSCTGHHSLTTPHSPPVKKVSVCGWYKAVRVMSSDCRATKFPCCLNCPEERSSLKVRSESLSDSVWNPAKIIGSSL